MVSTAVAFVREEILQGVHLSYKDELTQILTMEVRNSVIVKEINPTNMSSADGKAKIVKILSSAILQNIIASNWNWID